MDKHPYAIGELAQVAERVYTTGELARVCELPQYTIIRWHNEGTFRPSLRRAKGRRRYTLNDLVAAIVTQASRDDLHFPPERVAEIARIVQRAKDDELKNSWIVTFRSETPGMMRHLYVPHDADEEQRDLEALRTTDRIIDQASLHQVVFGRDREDGVRDPGILEVIFKRLQDLGLAEKDAEAH